MIENNKKLRVIVWDCEGQKVIHDEMGDLFLGGISQGRELGTIVCGYAPKWKRLAFARAMIKICKKIKRIIRKEKDDG